MLLLDDVFEESTFLFSIASGEIDFVYYYLTFLLIKNANLLSFEAADLDLAAFIIGLFAQIFKLFIF